MIYITDDCDFESATICQYVQDTTDDFDWTRDFGGTTSTTTGPSVDHTYQTKTGNFFKVNIDLVFLSKNKCIFIYGTK